MDMNPSQVNQVLAALNSKWGSGRLCPYCQHFEWSLSRKIFELREYHGGGLVVGTGALLPLVAMTCGYCGNTVLLNSIVLGVTEPTTPSPTPGGGPANE